MSYDTASKWRLYMGIMTESTVKRGQRWFHIYCQECLPMVNGDIAPEDTTNDITIENVFTQQKEHTTAKVTKTIYADYFGINSNVSVPTMYKGQQVLLINYGHNDRWYWIDLDRDRVLKTFETFRLSANDKAVTNKTVVVDPEDIETKNDEGLTDDTTYFLEVDTKYNKRIILRTSATDGEEYRYGIEIDAKAHTVRIWDEPDVVITNKGSAGTYKDLLKIKDAARGDQYLAKNDAGVETTYTFDGHIWTTDSVVQSHCNRTTPVRNQIVIESKQVNPRGKQWGRITVQNACGTSIILDDEDMDINVPRNLNMFVGGNFSSNIIGNKCEHVVSTVNYTHDATYTHLVNNAYSLTVNDSIGILVLKNFAMTIQELMSINVVKDASLTCASWLINVVTGVTLNTTTMITIVAETWQVTSNFINGSVKLLRSAGSRCGFHYRGDI